MSTNTYSTMSPVQSLWLEAQAHFPTLEGMGLWNQSGVNECIDYRAKLIVPRELASRGAQNTCPKRKYGREPKQGLRSVYR